MLDLRLVNLLHDLNLLLVWLAPHLLVAVLWAHLAEALAMIILTGATGNRVLTLELRQMVRDSIVVVSLKQVGEWDEALGGALRCLTQSRPIISHARLIVTLRHTVPARHHHHLAPFL